MTIGERLVSWRKKNKLKTTEVCESTGISTGALSNYENDKREISSSFLLKLKEIYDADIYYILTNVRIDEKSNITENEKEMLESFRKLPDREQIKIIGIVEDKARAYPEKQEESSTSKTG